MLLTTSYPGHIAQHLIEHLCVVSNNNCVIRHMQNAPKLCVAEGLPYTPPMGLQYTIAAFGEGSHFVGQSMLLFKQERVEKEINIRLQGIGLSLVNHRIHKEIAYMAISRSAAIILSTVGCFCPFTCGAMYTCLL